VFLSVDCSGVFQQSVNVGRGELALPSGCDAAKVQGLGYFGQFAQARLFHYLRDHLAESGVSDGGNLLAGFNRFGDCGLIVRIPQFAPRRWVASKASLVRLEIMFRSCSATATRM